MNDMVKEANQPLAEHIGAPANPVLVEVTRGDMVESRHRAAVAVADPAGKVVLSAGDIERPIYARSAIKPLQAIALVETGAAEAYGVSDAEIALACASHSGEPRHVETAKAWLERIGCGVADLECGAHLPHDEAAMTVLLHGGGEATPAHNNCSGKHAGFLTAARHLGAPTRGYIRYEHPVQQRVLGVLESLAGLDLGAAPRGIDGCGVPVIGIPLGNVALAMARFADPYDQPDARQSACARIRAAMAAEPFMVAGSGRFCTRVIEATGGRALVKTGAEGVYCGAVPDLGLGVALKVDDGNGRAAQTVMAHILQRLGVIGATGGPRVGRRVRNRAGAVVGRIRLSADAPI